MAIQVFGEYLVPFERAIVWAALFDPPIVIKSVPGCQRVISPAPMQFEADIRVKIGPISAIFTGTIKVEDAEEPAACTLVGQGQGGIAGYFKGTSRVLFRDVGGKTVVSYAVSANSGGRLAFLGQIIIDAFAKRFADQFFDAFFFAIAEQQMQLTL